MADPTDAELLSRTAAGRADALRTLYARHGDRVYNLVLGYVQQTELAEELTQDVFLRVWRGAKGFRGGSRVTTWLYRIAVNVALTAADRQKRHLRVSGTLPATDPPDFSHPGALLEDTELNQRIFGAIYALPGKQRAAFLLSFVEGLPRQQVADILQLGLKATESLLMRAKTNLRIQLSDHDRP